MTKRAIIGAKVFDGTRMHKDAALLLDDDVFDRILSAKDVPAEYRIIRATGGIILPGFVDLQVNGGGGVMFNDDPSVATLRTMSDAHAKTGTRAFLPTLITDTPDCLRAGVIAVEQAIDAGVPGIIGIHLEGPHLSNAKKGAHDPALIRPMEDADEAFLVDAASRIPNVMVTVAPESVTSEQIRRLAEAEIIVSLGHTDCTYAQARVAFAAGALCVTHLFNAMSQMTAREPGLVGAALDAAGVSAGLIADNIHVHASTMRSALSAKREQDAIFLVTDAMATAGSDITEFTLNGRKVHRVGGRLMLEDGTLAGADLDVASAIKTLVTYAEVSPADALRMATSIPAKVLHASGNVGHFVQGQPANAIHLGESFEYLGTP
ncbi:N-acetylglucosamine-6-phosphate deacetylase [Roseobacter sp. CCS2]|uniref:N-acetylglucosamine-6-phosphate deacetylase n=1 Tax=Roseobacter sp. CCS2 TaxID=391593 RepID=UPI0000F40523|nr:N-acetylglucosamine-6-phosphate deacetylase [Roseobacter sp. CCS2]EBA13940.1 N-acetylglucosamine-6-phosphate deacetylase [Roseobacter sp. CCS2]